MSEARTVDVLDGQGGKQGSVELPAELFDVTANIPLIHQVVVAQLAAARQGTHSTKTRAEVRGGGAKPYRQKGTGRARQGSIRAPQYVGGGVVHGPTPHGYAQRTPKKMIAAALRGALSDRARDGRVHVLSQLVPGDTPSTKAALTALAAATNSVKVLVVLERDDDVAWLSLRNAATVHALAVDQLNTYDVLVNDEVVFTAAALEAFIARPVAGKSGKATARESEVAHAASAETAGAATASAETADAETSQAEIPQAEAPQAQAAQPEGAQAEGSEQTTEDADTVPTNEEFAAPANGVDEPVSDGTSEELPAEELPNLSDGQPSDPITDDELTEEQTK